MTMKGALEPRSVLHKFYVARGSGEKGLIGWEDCVGSEEWCVKNEGEFLLVVTDVGVTEKEDAKSRFDLRWPNIVSARSAVLCKSRRGF